MLNVIKAFLPYIRAAPSERTISNFGSVGSWRGGAGYALYTGTKWACSGISEALRAELAPLGVAVTVIEPGYFRTGFLNAGAQVKSEKRIQEYDDTVVGQVRATLDKVNNNQPGDVVKGSKVLVDVLTRTGVADGKEIPMRVILGSDCASVVRAKCAETIELLDEWEDITTRTNHE
jgi:NAD(P)-dependent dehydrogenase (short-subunit alcohol dehydrogenase family)